MKTTFHNKRISGILGILPENYKTWEEEVIDGDSPRNQKIKKNMGYGRRYRVKKGTTISDMCIYGLRYLFEQNVIAKDEIAAILVGTFTPDYYVPQVSNLIHAAFDLPKDILCVDYWVGCCGYVELMLQAMMVLDKNPKKKVLIFTGETLHPIVEGQKYKEPVYGGDGASITIMENANDNSDIPLILRCDGKGRELITLKQGAFADIFHNKLSATVQTDPGAAFRYFQEKVAVLIEDLLQYSALSKENIEVFFSIQANKLAVWKYADRLGLDREKMPYDLVSKYGDMSATINPISIIDYYGEEMLNNRLHRVLVCGYGAGARYGGAVLDIGNMDVCEFINTKL